MKVTCPRCGHTDTRPGVAPSAQTPCDDCRRLDEAAAETMPSHPGARGPVTETLPPGFILGGCRIEAPLGRGGMGAVYRAVRLDRGESVAIKVLPEALGATPELRERFRREGALLRALDHPHVLRLLDRGEEAGRAFIVMEEVLGGSLRERLRAGPLEPCDALEIGRQVLEALAEAHAHGLVHRDVKPANVLLARDGSVRLSDFGMARLPPGGGDGLTAPGVPVGTYAYMAPEQRVSGRDVDARADLWAVGALLFEMLTGQRPQGPGLPGALRPGIGLRLDAFVARALSEAPEARFQTATEMLEELEPLRETAALGRRLLDEADLALAAGEIGAARDLVVRAAALLPDDPRVRATARSVEASTDPCQEALDALERRVEDGDLLGARDALRALADAHPGHPGVVAMESRVASRLGRVALLAGRAAAALRCGRDDEAYLAAGATFDYLPPRFAREAGEVTWPDPHRILAQLDLLRRARRELEVARARGDRGAARSALRRIRAIAPGDSTLVPEGSARALGRPLRLAAAVLLLLGAGVWVLATRSDEGGESARPAPVRADPAPRSPEVAAPARQPARDEPAPSIDADTVATDAR